MVVGAKVCELTDGFLWFVCGNFDVSPYPRQVSSLVNLHIGIKWSFVFSCMYVCFSRSMIPILLRDKNHVRMKMG